MRVKPVRKSKVLVEIGPGESRLLSEGGSRKSNGSRTSISRILVAIDFSSSSKKAFAYAAELAAACSAEIICLNVVEASYGAGELGLIMETQAMLAREEEGNRQMLAELISGANLKKARPIVRSGTPYNEIIRVARSEQADLVIVGTHKKRALSRMLLGSTSERVVRYAPCPVLVFRPARSARRAENSTASK